MKRSSPQTLNFRKEHNSIVLSPFIGRKKIISDKAAFDLIAKAFKQATQYK